MCTVLIHEGIKYFVSPHPAAGLPHVQVTSTPNSVFVHRIQVLGVSHLSLDVKTLEPILNNRAVLRKTATPTATAMSMATTLKDIGKEDEMRGAKRGKGREK